MNFRWSIGKVGLAPFIIAGFAVTVPLLIMEHAAPTIQRLCHGMVHLTGNDTTGTLGVSYAHSHFDCDACIYRVFSGILYDGT